MSEVLITSSVLICIIILLRALLKNRVSAVFIYSLWLLAALRLLLPLELAPSAMSVMNVVPRANIEETPALRLEPPESEIVLPATPEVGLHGASGVGSVDTETQQGGSGAVHSPGNTGHRPDAQMLLRAIWLLGTAVMAVYLLAVNGRMYLKLRGERRCVEIVGVELRVYLVDTLPSPCLSGTAPPAYSATSALTSARTPLSVPTPSPRTRPRPLLRPPRLSPSRPARARASTPSLWPSARWTAWAAASAPTSARPRA